LSQARLDTNQVMSERDALTIITLSLVSGITFVLAYLLGATGSGGEIEAGTADYLWTRPRSRGQMNWMHWGVCVGELAVVALIPALISAAIVLSLPGQGNYWILLLAPLLFVFAALPVLGITVLMAAVRRSANGALIFSAGIMLGYEFVVDIIRRFWGWEAPGLSTNIISWLLETAEGTTHHGAFPWAAALRVGVLAMAFPLAAQYVLKKAEI
jgi:ABC-type transport system involved in multi-copper enzyme maturation permease subunit